MGLAPPVDAVRSAVVLGGMPLTMSPSMRATIRSSEPSLTSTTPTVSPSRRTVARSQTAAISISRCEMKMTEWSVPRWRADDLEDPLGEVGRQGRGHLVEHQDVRFDGQGACEVDDAQRGERQGPGGRREVEPRDPELVEPGAEGVDRRPRQAEIRGDVEVGDEGRFLVDRHDAAASGLTRRMSDERLAADEDRAGVRPDCAGQDLDEGALAGAVGAHQGVDLAGLDGERGRPQRGDRSVVLGDAGDVEQQVRHVFAVCPSCRFRHGTCTGVPAKPTSPQRV